MELCHLALLLTLSVMSHCALRNMTIMIVRPISIIPQCERGLKEMGCMKQLVPIYLVWVSFALHLKDEALNFVPAARSNTLLTSMGRSCPSFHGDL